LSGARHQTIQLTGPEKKKQADQAAQNQNPFYSLTFAFAALMTAPEVLLATNR